MKEKFELYQGLRWLNSQKKGEARKTEASQELTEYKRKLIQTEPDDKFIDIDYEKETARFMYREGYYDANPKTKTHRGSMIMENTIDKDFEKNWKILKQPKSLYNK
jgi:hypothetical protein